MEINFKDYFLSEFKHAHGNFRLYHDWIYDQVFSKTDLPPEVSKLIKAALFKATWSTLWTSEFLRIDYEREVLKRARIPSGELKGKVIDRLGTKREYIPLLIPWTKCDNEIIAKAARNKINSIELRTEK